MLTTLPLAIQELPLVQWLARPRGQQAPPGGVGPGGSADGEAPQGAPPVTPVAQPAPQAEAPEEAQELRPPAAVAMG